MAFYMLATIEPALESQIHRDPKATPIHTVTERIELTKRNAARDLPTLDLILDHAGGELLPGTERLNLPHNKRIGRGVDLLVRSNGQWLATLEVFHERDELANLIALDIENGIPWGVSLGKDLGIPYDRYDILSKDITHLGLTRNPQYGAHAEGGGTWVLIARPTKDAFYKELGQFLNKESDMFIPDQTRERLARLIPLPVSSKADEKINAEVVMNQAEKAEEEDVMQIDTDAAAPPPLAKNEHDVSEGRAQSDSDNPLKFTSPVLGSEEEVANPVDVAFAPLPIVISQEKITEPMATATPDPMQGVTTPGTATATIASPGPVTTNNDLSQRYATLYEKAGKLYNQFLPDPKGNPTPLIDPSLYMQAVEWKKDFSGLVQGLEPDAWPDGAHDIWHTLTEYVKTSKEKLSKFAAELYKDYPEDKMRVVEALEKPLLKENLMPARQVFANYSKSLKNTEEFTQQFQSQREAMITAEANAKRDREAWEKEKATILAEKVAEKAALEAELASLKKARTEAPAVNHAVIPGAAGGLNTSPLQAISVGASGNTRSSSLPEGSRLVPSPFGNTAKFGTLYGDNNSQRLAKAFSNNPLLGDLASRSSLFSSGNKQ